MRRHLDHRGLEYGCAAGGGIKNKKNLSGNGETRGSASGTIGRGWELGLLVRLKLVVQGHHM